MCPDVTTTDLKCVSGIRLIMDFVPNHSSRNHSWFMESRKGGTDNKYKDYYVWHEGKEDPANPGGRKLPPNNWVRTLF